MKTTYTPHFIHLSTSPLALATCLLITAICLTLPASVHAQEAMPDMDERQFPQESGGSLGGELGIGQIDEDFFLKLNLQFTFGLPVPMAGCSDTSGCITRLRFGLQVPLNLRIYDRAPENEGVWREEDWSEFSDYLRVIRFVEYGYPHEPFYGRIGELGPVVMGHGTIINGYYNVITTDRYQLGVQGNVNTAYGGVETMINNLGGPSILGIRGYVRPWAFIDREDWLNRVAVGTSIVSDISAPVRLERELDGSIHVGPNKRPVVEEAQATTIMGFDVEVSLLEHERLNLTPYTDFNYHFQLGGGLHSGILFQLWPLDSLGLFTRLEYRFLGSQYLPDYIGPLYEVDRFQYAGWTQGLPAPKLRIARGREGSLHGWYGSLTANILNIISAAVAYEDYQGPDNAALRARITLHGSEAFQFGVFYYKQNFDTLDEIFELDGALLVTEARVPITGPLYLKAQYSRLWRLEDTGEYSTVHDWNLGVGAAFAF